ncbi:MAG: BglII/BstYI family type II restriction endonuclease [Pseudomonadota bacterium]
MFKPLRDIGYQIETRNHAEAILGVDFAPQVSALTNVLKNFRLKSEDIIKSGGGHAELTMRLRDALVEQGWEKHNFVAQTIVDGRELVSTSHEIDHVCRSTSGTIALEIEWNNKDPFFDRDLENFHRLHSQSAISLGIMITRGSSLQESMVDIVAKKLRNEEILDLSELEDWGVKERTARQKELLEKLLEKQVPFADAFAKSFVGDKFGQATTHWNKLQDRIDRGVGNPCPLLLIGIPVSVVEDYSAATLEL